LYPKDTLESLEVIELIKLEWIKGFWIYINPSNKMEKSMNFFKVNLLRCLHWNGNWKNLNVIFAIITYWMLLFRIMKKLLHVIQSLLGKQNLYLYLWSLLMEFVLFDVACDLFISMTIVTFWSCFIWVSYSIACLLFAVRQPILGSTFSRFSNPCHHA